MKEKVASFAVNYIHADVKLLHGRIRGKIIWAPCFYKIWITAAVVGYVVSFDAGKGEVADDANADATVVATTTLMWIKIELFLSSRPPSMELI